MNYRPTPKYNDSDQGVTIQAYPKEVGLPPTMACEMEAVLRKIKNGKEARKVKANIEIVKAGDETIAKVGFVDIPVDFTALPVGFASLPVDFAAVPVGFSGLPVGFAALPLVYRFFRLARGSSGALSLASPGVPGNCRKQCSVPGKLPGDTMVVLVGQMGILSAHAWCGTSVKNTMEEIIIKRIIYVNLAIL